MLSFAVRTVAVAVCTQYLHQFTNFPSEKPTQLAGNMETVRHRRGGACRRFVCAFAVSVTLSLSVYLLVCFLQTLSLFFYLLSDD